jgi:hypothetical protein
VMSGMSGTPAAFQFEQNQLVLHICPMHSFEQ